MAELEKLTVGTILEEKSTGRENEITGVADCTAAAYGKYVYKIKSGNPPNVYSNDIGKSPTQKFAVVRAP